MADAPETWLSGPVDGVSPYVMPVAHALLQTARDLEGAAADLTTEELWARPGGAASIGFHLQHVAGALDRLLTCARGEELRAEQRRALESEGRPGLDHGPDPPRWAMDQPLTRPTRSGDALLHLPRQYP